MDYNQFRAWVKYPGTNEVEIPWEHKACNDAQIYGEEITKEQFIDYDPKVFDQS